MRAVDIDCPKGCALAGFHCGGLQRGADCQARINAAGAITKANNRALRDTTKGPPK